MLMETDGRESAFRRFGKRGDDLRCFDAELNRSPVGRGDAGGNDLGIEAASEARIPAHGNADLLSPEPAIPDALHDVELLDRVDVHGQAVNGESIFEIRAAAARSGEKDSPRREAGLESGVDFAGRDGIDPGPLGLQHFENPGKGIGFQGVGDPDFPARTGGE